MPLNAPPGLAAVFALPRRRIFHSAELFDAIFPCARGGGGDFFFLIPAAAHAAAIEIRKVGRRRRVMKRSFMLELREFCPQDFGDCVWGTRRFDFHVGLRVVLRSSSCRFMVLGYLSLGVLGVCKGLESYRVE